MKYPTELIEKAEYEVSVFERVARDTGIELIEEVKRLRQEITALRGFASYIIGIKNNIDVVDINDAARDYCLIDEYDNPTPLLTGESV